MAFCAVPAFPQGTADAPLSLEQCKELAASVNVEVARSEAELRAAERTQSAARIERVPQASALTGAYEASTAALRFGVPTGNLPVIDAAGQPTGDSAFFPGDRVEAGKGGSLMALVAVQPLYSGGRIANANKLADVGVRAAEERRVMTRRDARIEAEAKYWQIVALAEKDRTLRAYQDTLTELEREAADALASGLSTRNDLLEVSLERGRAQVQRLELESARRLAARDLRRFLGLPDGDEIVLADAAPPDPVEPAADPESESEAPSGRVEIRLLESAVEAEGLKARLERGEGLPSFALGAAAIRSDLSDLDEREAGVVFGVVTVPVTGIWRAKHKAAAARERQRATELRLDDTRRVIAEQVAKAWDDLEAAWEAEAVSELGVEQAEVNLMEERDGYEAGFETLSDLLEAQTLLHQATDRRVDAKIALALRRSEYRRAVGEE
jgi:outer membrane protein TolC